MRTLLVSFSSNYIRIYWTSVHPPSSSFSDNQTKISNLLRQITDIQFPVSKTRKRKLGQNYLQNRCQVFSDAQRGALHRVYYTLHCWLFVHNGETDRRTDNPYPTLRGRARGMTIVVQRNPISIHNGRVSPMTPELMSQCPRSQILSSLDNRDLRRIDSRSNRVTTSSTQTLSDRWPRRTLVNSITVEREKSVDGRVSSSRKRNLSLEPGPSLWF